MKKLYTDLLNYQVSQSDNPDETKSSILNMWNSSAPHFGGTALHRYDGVASDYLNTRSLEQVCVYCLRPRKYKNLK